MKSILFGALGIVGAGGLFYILKKQGNMSTQNSLIAVAALSALSIGSAGLVGSIDFADPKKKGDKKKAEPAPTTAKPSTPVPPPIPPIPPASKKSSTTTESQLLSDAEKGLTSANLNNLNSFLNGFKST